MWSGAFIVCEFVVITPNVETDWLIAEVAEMVGYSNPGHFAVAFRGEFTITPGDYKKLVRSER